MYPILPSGEYVYDTVAGKYVFSASDAGQSASATLAINQQNQLYTTELYVVPLAAPYQVIVDHGGEQKITKADGSTSNSVIFTADAGVSYYPTGTALTNVPSSPAAGQYSWANTSVGGVGGYGVYTFNSADAGKEVEIKYEYLNPDYDSFVTQFSTALDFRPGVLGQTPSAYMESAHPSQDVGYSLSAIVEADNGYLGTTGVLPNYSYEVMGFGIVGGGVLDADPIASAAILLTDPIVGVGIPSSAIDSVSWYSGSAAAQKWCAAGSLYISQAVQNHTPAAAVIGRWLGAFNVAAFVSEGVIKLAPYGDQATGSYTPNTTVQASLDDDVFLRQGNSDPVTMNRTAWADAYNRVQVNYRNRQNSYNSDLVYEQDEASVERFGLRIRAPEDLDFITSWQLATAVANMALKRLVTVRNTYQFRLPITYEFLEPMDLVSLTDSRLGLDGQVVRITKITNTAPASPTKPGGLDVECEDWPGNGYAMPVTNPKAAVPSLHPTRGVATAGNTSLLIVQASNVSATQQGSALFIWARGADSVGWGGCAVYLSTDGTSYQQLGVVPAAAPIFALAQALPSVTPAPSGPLNLTHDTSSTITVAPATIGNQVVSTAGVGAYNPDTSYAQGVIVSYDGQPWFSKCAVPAAEVPTDSSPYWQRVVSATTQAPPPATITDAAAATLGNLSAVIGLSAGVPSAVEFLTYADVAPASLPNQYALTDLYRGALGTVPTAFSAGAQMVTFASASLIWEIPAGMAGQTVYLKAVAWNNGAFSSQTLANVPPTEFTIAAANGVGVWDGLGGPVADVVKVGTGGSGELVVNPPGGVSGDLPHANSSTQTQAVINTSAQVVNTTLLDDDASNSIGEGHLRAILTLTHAGNVVSGARLGGDSGLQAYGSSNDLGFDGTPSAVSSAVTVHGANTSILQIGTTPAITLNDTTTTTGREYYTQSFEGSMLQADDAGGTRTTISSSGAVGIGSQVPVYGFDNFLGTSRVNGGSPYTYWDDTVSNHNFYLQNDGGAWLTVDATSGAATRQYMDSSGQLAIGGSAPGAQLDALNGGVRSSAAQATLLMNDTSGHEWGMQSAYGTWRSYDYYANAVRHAADGSGNFALGSAAPSYKLSVYGQQTDVNYSDALSTLTDANTGHSFGHQSVSSALHIVDSTAGGAQRLAVDASGYVAIGSQVPVSGYPLSVLGVGVFDSSSYMRASLGPYSTALNNQGSTQPMAGTAIASIAMVTSPSVGVEVTVTAGTIYRPDGSTIAVPAFSQTYTTWDGQTVAYPPQPGSGTNWAYYLGNVVWNIASGAVQVQQTYATAYGGADAGPPTQTAADTAAAAGDGLIPIQIGLYAGLKTTSAGGQGSGGGGGGSNVCPCADQLVLARGRGAVLAGDLRVGDHLEGPCGWVRITRRRDVREDAVEVLVRRADRSIERLRVTPAHPFLLAEGVWRAAAALRRGDRLFGSGRVWSRRKLGVCAIAQLSCNGHVYRLGSTWSHNICIE